MLGSSVFDLCERAWTIGDAARNKSRLLGIYIDTTAIDCVYRYVITTSGYDIKYRPDALRP